MFFTNKSILKNAKKVLGDKVSYYLTLRKTKFKTKLLIMDNDGNLYFLTAPLFGTPKLKKELKIDEITGFDFVITASQVNTYGVIITTKNEIITGITTPSLFVPDYISEITNYLYLRNPNIKPEYMQNQQLVGVLYTNEGNLKITDKKIFIQKWQNNHVNTIGEINPEDIKSVDVLPRNIGNDILLLQLKDKLIKTRIGTIVSIVKLPQLVDLKLSRIPNLYKIMQFFKAQGIKDYKPSYLEEDEVPLYATKAATGKISMGISSFTTKFVRFTNKGILFLKEEKENIILEKRIPYTDIVMATLVKIVEENSVKYNLELELNNRKSQKIRDIEHPDIVKEVMNKYWGTLQ